MSAGMYDVNGKPLMQPRNVMTEFDRVAAWSIEASHPIHLNQIQHFPNSMTHRHEPEHKLLPVTERAIQESQLALQREYEKHKKLDDFQKRTKRAANNYNQTVKSESHLKIEQEKKEIELKQKKVKEFEERLKLIRKSMKVKPTNELTKNTSKKNISSTKKQIGVHVKTGPNKQSANIKQRQLIGHAGKENIAKNYAYNSKVKKPFGATSVWWGASSLVAEIQQFHYPTYFPVTDWVNAPTKETRNNGNKPKNKLAQITATSVAIPFAPESRPVMEKSSSIEISMDKHNFEYSSNMNSKVSDPLRESELLDLDKKALKNSSKFNEFELQKDAFLQSQERRLPLSKLSSDNSGLHHDRLTNGVASNFLNNMNEIPEEISVDYINQNMEYEYQESMEDEPVPKHSLPVPQPMVTDYKAARDQKKWQKVNSGLAMF